MTAFNCWWPANHSRVAVEYASLFPPAMQPAINDNTPASDPSGVNELSVALATFPDAILLTIEGDDDLAAEWRRLYPLHQRAQAEDAAYQLAEFYGLPLRSDDCTHVQVTHG